MNFNPDALRTIRERSGYSKAALADAARIDRSTLTRLENGTRQPSPSMVRQLAHALNCPIPALLGPDEGNPS